MNYEEKYKQAFERAKERYSVCSAPALLEYIFPELKESEDEQIRKTLIDYFQAYKEQKECGITTFYGISTDNILTWLEKQGEQQGKSALEAWRDMRLEVYQQASGNRHEPNYSDDRTKMFSLEDIDEIIEKISEQTHAELGQSEVTKTSDQELEPKFHEGEWIISNTADKDYHICKITGIKDGNYTIESICGYKGYNQFDVFDTVYKLWTITDAKDGDVLSYVIDEEDLWIMIYRSLYEPYEGHVHYHALLFNDNFTDKGTCCICIDNLKPATKEQRDLLFQKMKEAGWEWDGDKKELKKVEPEFHEGDWVVYNNDICQIVKRDEGCNKLVTVFGIEKELVNERNLSTARLWSIQDAKDGDVLFHSDSASNGIFVFKEILQCGTIQKVLCYCDYDSEDGFCLGENHTCCWTNNKILHPATKEQRDTLIKAMANAGYTFDFEKKELKKIESKTLDPDKVIEWLNDQACQGWIEDVEVDKFVDKFKKDFGL